MDVEAGCWRDWGPGRPGPVCNTTPGGRRNPSAFDQTYILRRGPLRGILGVNVPTPTAWRLVSFPGGSFRKDGRSYNSAMGRNASKKKKNQKKKKKKKTKNRFPRRGMKPESSRVDQQSCDWSPVGIITPRKPPALPFFPTPRGHLKGGIKPAGKTTSSRSEPGPRLRSNGPAVEGSQLQRAELGAV